MDVGRDASFRDGRFDGTWRQGRRYPCGSRAARLRNKRGVPDVQGSNDRKVLSVYDRTSSAIVDDRDTCQKQEIAQIREAAGGRFTSTIPRPLGSSSGNCRMQFRSRRRSSKAYSSWNRSAPLCRIHAETRSYNDCPSMPSSREMMRSTTSRSTKCMPQVFRMRSSAR